MKAFNEAENYNGPAIIIAYAHCIKQGLLTKTGPAHQKAGIDIEHGIANKIYRAFAAFFLRDADRLSR